MGKPVSITVVGAGAVGGTLAFLLARAGLAPRLLCRGAALAAIRRDGLRVEGKGGGEAIRIEATDDAASLGPQDLVIGTMKAQDWPAGMASLRPLLGPETVLLPVINGVPWWYFDGVTGPLAGRPVRAVDPDGALLAALPARRVIGSVVYMGAARTAPGIVNWTSGIKLVIGEASGAARERTGDLAAVLGRTGMSVVLHDHIRVEIWTKLLGNTSFNTLATVARADTLEIMDDPGLAAIALASMTEVAAVAQAVGAPSSMDVPQRFAINRDLGAFKPSTYQDFEAGRALELGALVDAVVEIGNEIGVPTPMTQALGALARRAVLLRDAAG